MAKQNNFHQPDPSKQGNGDGNDAAVPGPGTGDMLKSVYDSNDDGRVDSADHATTANTADELADNPGLSLYYGYDSLGVKGWHSFGDAINGANAFTELSDTPATYIGAAGYTVKVKGDGTGLEFVAEGAGVTNFLGLTDTPSAYTGQAGKMVVVNGPESALEFTDVPATGASDFLGLSDTPADYTGQAGQLVAVKGTEDGVEFIAPPAEATGFKDLTTLTKAGTGTLPNWAAWVADASGGALTRAMPTTPADGEEVTVHDVSGVAATNNITVTVVGPTTITQPTLNLNNQSKKWRYDATGDNWDLVFNNAPSAGGGGGFLTNTDALNSSDDAIVYSSSAFNAKGMIYTVNNAVNLRAVAIPYDVSTSGASVFSFTVAKVSGVNSTIDEIVFQETVAGGWFGSGSADLMLVAMDLDLDASQDYAFILSKTGGTARVSFPATAGNSDTDFTYVGSARFNTTVGSLPTVGEDTYNGNGTTVHMYFAYS